MNGFHLGINLGHDRSAALVHNGKLITAIHQERLDRCKHSIGYLSQSLGDPRWVQLPHEAIHYCLDAAGIVLDDLETISGNMPGVDCSNEILHRQMPASLHGKIRQIPSHHLAHAYTAYWPSGFDSALIMVADGAGTTGADHLTESYSLYQAKGDTLQLLHAERVPAHFAGLSTLGLLYEHIARRAGFSTELGGGLHAPEAGKLMGLAPFGGPQPAWNRWITPREGSYSLDLCPYDIFLEMAALEQRYDDGKDKPYMRPYLVDLAYKIQEELEEGLLHVVKHALKETGLTQLCLAGGVALNSVANYRLLQELPLDDLFAFPAAGDAGVAAGCAYWASATENTAQNKPVQRHPIKHTGLGRSYGKEHIENAVQRFEGRVTVEVLGEQEVIERTAKALAQGHIVARVDGGSEFGPRALGQRSILADPTFERMRDIINARVKFRESFRPFAPVVPLEQASLLFKQPIPSPFMLIVSAIRPQYHKEIPSVTHCDGTGRLQTVTLEDNPFLHRLCHQVAELRDGPAVVLNTSFNVAGQPIVETPEEAVATFLNTDIDYLCIDGYWIYKSNEPVLNYEEHLARVEDGPLPQGLPPGQPAVSEIMESLDNALFFNGNDKGWSQESLARLSTEGGLYRDRSRLFPQAPFPRPSSEWLPKPLLLLFDPLGHSLLVDAGDETHSMTLSFTEVKQLAALLIGDEDYAEQVRTESQMEPARWRTALHGLVNQLHEYFGLQLTPPVDDTPDASITTEDGPLLANFADAQFTLRHSLGQLRQLLDQHGYEAGRICALLDVESLQQIEPTHLHYFDRYRLGDHPLDDLVRIFLLRGAIPRGRLERLFPIELAETLSTLGLLHPRGEHWAAAVDLFSIDGMYFATDHRYLLLEEDIFQEQPVMYIGLDSLGLAMAAPRYPANRLLDLCAGSGIQGLVASRYTREVVAVDVNPRAIRFARFNAQLNGVRNYHIEQGDLYHAVENERFDVILANPPFVPSPNQQVRFRDGGTSGEEILWRIINDAADHLTTEGKLHIVTDLVNVPTYEEKLTRWWRGGSAISLLLHTAERDEILFSVPHVHRPFGQPYKNYNEELGRWVDNYRAASLNGVDFGYILLHRAPANQYNEQGLAVIKKVVHSPRHPIHQTVKKHFALLDTLYRRQSGDLYVHPMQEVVVNTAKPLAGGDDSHSLTVGDNPYFTTYKISEEVAHWFRQIASHPVTFNVAERQLGQSTLMGLFHLGLLNLSGHFSEPTGYRQTETETGIVSDNENHYSLIEMRTKTTPTCLSSYIG